MTFEETLQTAEMELLQELRREELAAAATIGLHGPAAHMWAERYGGKKRAEITEFIEQCRKVGMMLARPPSRSMQ